MKLIVGLGNPGEKYKKTRHNAGFLVVNDLVQCLKRQRGACGTWHLHSKAACEIIDCHLNVFGDFSKQQESAEKVLVLFGKPQTGMNSSGEAAKKLVGEKGVALDNILVVHDDADINLGEYKLQKNRGAAGHNGVQSVINALGTKGFWRLRVGISNPAENGEMAEYVLADFSDCELRAIKDLIKDELLSVVEKWVEKR